MSKQSYLHSPFLRDRFEHCLQCGYSLEGIPVPGHCPECGLPILEGRTSLCISGVARGSSGPVWRKVVWVFIGIYGFLYSQLFGIAIISFPWFALIGFAILIVPLLAMAFTGKQKKRGTELFVFTHDGFSRWTAGSDPTTRFFTQWVGVKRGVQISRVSSVWAKFEIVAVDEQGKHTRPLRGGFRCPQEDIEIIEQVLNALLTETPLDSIEHLESSAFFAIEPDESVVNGYFVAQDS